MNNPYADAIDVIARDMDLHHMKLVCIDYAKRHPKAFVHAAANAGNKRAIKITHPTDSGHPENEKKENKP